MSGALGWGFGFHSAGEVLMRRQPVDDDRAIDFARLLTGVRGDTLIAHVRSATVGALRPENTHPFRFRGWLFAQTGTLPGYDHVAERVDAAIPAFLRANVNGETDAERAFHLLLSHLDAAHAINVAGPGALADAIKRTLDDIARWCGEVNGAPVEAPRGFNWMIADARSVTLLCLGAPGFVRTFEGVAAANLYADDPKQSAATALQPPTFSLIATDFRTAPPSPWVPCTHPLMTLCSGQPVRGEALP
jgi:predicted glutamine amidotransferase